MASAELCSFIQSMDSINTQLRREGVIGTLMLNFASEYTFFIKKPPHSMLKASAINTFTPIR